MRAADDEAALAEAEAEAARDAAALEADAAEDAPESGVWARPVPGVLCRPGTLVRSWSEVAVKIVSSVPVMSARTRQQASRGSTMPSLASVPCSLSRRWRRRCARSSR